MEASPAIMEDFGRLFLITCNNKIAHKNHMITVSQKNSVGFLICAYFCCPRLFLIFGHIRNTFWLSNEKSKCMCYIAKKESKNVYTHTNCNHHPALPGWHKSQAFVQIRGNYFSVRQQIALRFLLESSISYLPDLAPSVQFINSVVSLN